jgi:hypothetical protein
LSESIRCEGAVAPVLGFEVGLARSANEVDEAGGVQVDVGFGGSLFAAVGFESGSDITSVLVHFGQFAVEIDNLLARWICFMGIDISLQFFHGLVNSIV